MRTASAFHPQTPVTRGRNIPDCPLARNIPELGRPTQAAESGRGISECPRVPLGSPIAFILCVAFLLTGCKRQTTEEPPPASSSAGSPSLPPAKDNKPLVGKNPADDDPAQDGAECPDCWGI